MASKSSALPTPAHLGGTRALSATPVVGAPARDYAETYVPGSEDLQDREIRVTVLGSGDPFVRRSQASGSLLIEVGNRERDFFFFDLGSGALANFTSMMLPVESTTKVFLSHLHADHVGDIPGLLGSIAKGGRIDPVEIWGGGSENPEFGLEAFVHHTLKALAWDVASFRVGAIPSSGCDAIPHEIPYDRPQEVYEAGGVAISSFPAIHGLSGAVGYALEYAGLRVVFSGDTRPCRFVTDAANGADLLVHECFQSPAIAAASFGIPADAMTARLKPAHTLPVQLGRILDMTKPRMGALWHTDVTPGVDAALAEVAESYDGAVVVSQDLTVFNVTAEAVVARQAKVVEAPHPTHGPSKGVPTVEPPPPPPSWWAAATLDL